MKRIQLKEAKANLSAVVDQAVKGKPSVITRHGKREAVVVGYADWIKMSRVPSFARLLMAMPACLPHERDETPLQDADL